MKRPKIELDLSNAEEVYAFYSNRQASQTFKPRLARVCSWLFSPYVYIAGETQEKIDQHFSEKGQFAYSISHASWLDVPNALAAVYRNYTLRNTLDRIATPAKAPIFENPLTAWAVLMGDGVPVIRDKDMKKAGTYNDITKARKKQLGPKVTDITIDRADRGSNIAFFPEGERRDRKSIDTQRVFQGLGNTVCRSVNFDNFMLVSIGIDYGEHGNQYRDPSVAIMTEDQIEKTPELATIQVAQSLQAVLDLAAAYNPERTLQ